ncbi:HAD family hydrolase [Rosettibacter firmus]|uniref:HAD family hydrolase n=1 Tax=Rosettibacter firmus TaxID=3111522 RepID=UPI00336BCFE9
MKIDLIVFDLDGTLISSHETIYKATINTLEKLKIENKLIEEKFYKRIGLHFEDIFNEFDMNVPDFKQFIDIYKSIYFDYIDSSFLYEGVNETLNKLKALEIKIALLTTKSQEQAELILEHFKIKNKFDYIMGRRPGIQHKPSPEPLLYICNEMKMNTQNTLMVGDSELDVMCGKSANSLTCAVTYGYRKKEDLIKTKPDFIIDNLFKLISIVNGRV